MKKQCKIILLDEVNCTLVGLHPDHIAYFYEEYGVFSTNYFFNPKYKLGSWDGKIRYFFKTGKTYINLLDDIIPRVTGLGYKVVIEDRRATKFVDPPHIDEDFFSNITEPDYGLPWKVRNYQIDMVNALIDNAGGVGIAGTGAGKAETLDSLVLTTVGWVRMGDITYDHVIITPDNKQANIVGIFPHEELDIYEITFHDGAKVRCCKDHLWKVKRPVKLWRADTEWDIIDTHDIKTFIDKKEQKTQHIPGNISIPLCDPIEFRHTIQQELPLDPYMLGALLGDGCFQPTPLISSADTNIIQRVSESVKNMEMQVVRQNNYDYRIIKNKKQNTFPPSPNPLKERLEELGLHGKKSHNKFVPSIFKYGTVEQRFELIRGLMDTDGTADKKGNISFTTISEQLATDIQEIIWSLGGTCTITKRYPTYSYNNKKHIGQLAYTCFIRHPNPKQLFSLERKKQLCREQHADGRVELMRRIVSIEYVSKEPAQCIMIDDPNHLYITNDYIVTHNTSMCAALALSYEKAGNLRSIIIVPDKNLTEQTVQEYKFFGLDVGEYSGDNKDIDHAHVVSTWQALQHNPIIIQQFQVIIVDEAHGLKGQVLTDLLNNYGKDIAYRFGVTGTMPKPETDAMAVKIAVGSIQYEIPAHVLIEQGYLAKLHIDIEQLSSDFHDHYQEYLEDMERSNDKPLSYKQFKDAYFPDWTAEKRYMQNEKDRLDWIAEKIEEKRAQKKGNVFCLVDGVAFGKKLTKMIPDAKFVYGKDKMKVRKQIYQLFKENDNLVVIANVQVASTGLDIKRIFNLMFIDLGKSFIRIIQTIGRGLRKAPDKDFVNVTDICSDFKYSKKHVRERIKFYKEAKYPYKKTIIKYQE